MLQHVQSFGTLYVLYFQANEMLLFGRQITARQACDWGLVTDVFPDATFRQEVDARIKQISQLPKQVTLFPSLNPCYLLKAIVSTK